MTVAIEDAAGVAGEPSGGPAPPIRLGGRFRLGERVTAADGLSLRKASLWKATDELLRRPVAVHLLPRGDCVPASVVEAVQAAARVSDPRLATIYDTDYSIEDPYIVSEWAPGTHLEDLVLSGLPRPALAAAMIADAADALAVAHQAGRPHLCLSPRSLRWDVGSGLKITGLGIDAALSGTHAADPAAADTVALGRMLYALLTGCWPGDEPTALPAAPGHKGQRVHPAAGPGRRARRPGHDHPARPPAPAGRPFIGGVHPGRAGHGPALGAAAFVLLVRPGRAGGLDRGPGPGHRARVAGPAREDPGRGQAPHHAAAPGGVTGRASELVGPSRS